MGGEVSQFFADLGTVVGGGIALGSIPGAIWGAVRHRTLTAAIESAAAMGLLGGIVAIVVLIGEATLGA